MTEHARIEMASLSSKIAGRLNAANDVLSGHIAKMIQLAATKTAYTELLEKHKLPKAVADLIKVEHAAADQSERDLIAHLADQYATSAESDKLMLTATIEIYARI